MASFSCTRFFSSFFVLLRNHGIENRGNIASKVDRIRNHIGGVFYHEQQEIDANDVEVCKGNDLFGSKENFVANETEVSEEDIVVDVIGTSSSFESDHSASEPEAVNTEPNSLP